MTKPAFDIEKAHRWFAVEFNNLAWDLYESVARTESDTERMIHAAHAACFHWFEVGIDVNRMRALCLLASAYAAAGLGELAVRYARQCVTLSDRLGDEQTKFDRATALGCAYLSYRVAGDARAAEQFYRSANEAAAALPDEDERIVFRRLFHVETK
jgi:hypothetical protein